MTTPIEPVAHTAYHGKDGKLYLSMTGTDEWVEIGKISAFTLDMTRDKVETTSLGDTNKTFLAGLKNTQGTFTGFFTAEEQLFDAADSPTGVYLALVPTDLVPNMCWRGPAWVDVSINSGVSAAVTINGTFSANGPWTRGALPTSVIAPLGPASGVVAQTRKAA